MFSNRLQGNSKDLSILQGLMSTLELLPMWGGAAPDVDLFFSGDVFDDDGEWAGGQTLGASADEAGESLGYAHCQGEPSLSVSTMSALLKGIKIRQIFFTCQGSLSVDTSLEKILVMVIIGASSSSGAAGSSSAAAGGSSAAGAGPAGGGGNMRIYSSQIQEWLVEYSCDRLFITIRTDVAWYRLAEYALSIQRRACSYQSCPDYQFEAH